MTRIKLTSRGSMISKRDKIVPISKNVTIPEPSIKEELDKEHIGIDEPVLSNNILSDNPEMVEVIKEVIDYEVEKPVENNKSPKRKRIFVNTSYHSDSETTNISLDKNELAVLLNCLKIAGREGYYLAYDVQKDLPKNSDYYRILIGILHKLGVTSSEDIKEISGGYL